MRTLGLNGAAVCAATCATLASKTHKLAENNEISSYQGLALLDILLLEQKLTVQVGNINGVEIQQGNLSETRQDDVLDYDSKLSATSRVLSGYYSRSSHPIPPAPTRSTFVLASCAYSSGPKIAFA